MLANLFPTPYGNVTAPAVLEIEAAEPVAVSAALLIHAPPVTRRPVRTRPAAPAATLPASRFSGWRDCHRNHAPATKQISAPTYIAVEAAKPPAVENSCAMVWTCAPIVPPAACANAEALANEAPPSAEARRMALRDVRERALRLMNERSVTSLLQGLNHEGRARSAFPSGAKVHRLRREQLRERTAASQKSSGDKHRDQRIGDGENVDQHDPKHELHHATHLTSVGMAIDHRAPGEKREEGAHRPETLKEPLKQRHDVHERRARRRSHQGRRV